MTYAKKPLQQKTNENNHGPSGANAVRTLPAVPVLQKAEILPIQELANVPLQKTPEANPSDTGRKDGLKSGLEHLSNYSLDEVKVHYKADMPAQKQTEHAMQMKEGVTMNGDRGLKKITDAEGSNALQLKKKKASENIVEIELSNLSATSSSSTATGAIDISSSSTITNPAIRATVTPNTSSVSILSAQSSNSASTCETESATSNASNASSSSSSPPSSSTTTNPINIASVASSTSPLINVYDSKPTKVSTISTTANTSVGSSNCSSGIYLPSFFSFPSSASSTINNPVNITVANSATNSPPSIPASLSNFTSSSETKPTVNNASSLSSSSSSSSSSTITGTTNTTAKASNPNASWGIGNNGKLKQFVIGRDNMIAQIVANEEPQFMPGVKPREGLRLYKLDFFHKKENGMALSDDPNYRLLGLEEKPDDYSGSNVNSSILIPLRSKWLQAEENGAYTKCKESDKVKNGQMEDYSDGNYPFVILANGELKIASAQSSGHTGLSKGAAVLMAGELTITNGIARYNGRRTGHYLANVEEERRGLEIMKKSYCWIKDLEAKELNLPRQPALLPLKGGMIELINNFEDAKELLQKHKESYMQNAFNDLAEYKKKYDNEVEKDKPNNQSLKNYFDEVKKTLALMQVMAEMKSADSHTVSSSSTSSSFTSSQAGASKKDKQPAEDVKVEKKS